MSRSDKRSFEMYDKSVSPLHRLTLCFFRKMSETGPPAEWRASLPLFRRGCQGMLALFLIGGAIPLAHSFPLAEDHPEAASSFLPAESAAPHLAGTTSPITLCRIVRRRRFRRMAAWGMTAKRRALWRYRPAKARRVPSRRQRTRMAAMRVRPLRTRFAMHPGKRPRITRIATLKRPIKTGMAHPARMEKAHPAGKTIAVAGLAARINGVWVEEGGRTEMLRVQMKANNGFLKVYAKNLPTQKGTFRQVFRDMILVQPGNQVYVVQMSPDRMDWSSPDGKERRRFFRNRLPERDAFARWKSGRAKPFFIRGENPKVQGDLPPRFGRE